ncbi:MAG: S-layer homology domain-containing protein [Oscillospiraceae bacterium]|nr:S-layer homology domain-containing protein [Oscillospiraceae bacterium]
MTHIFRRSTALIAMLALLLSLFGAAAYADSAITFTVTQVTESVDLTDGDAEMVLAIGIENNTGFAGFDLTLELPSGWEVASFATSYNDGSSTSRSILTGHSFTSLSNGNSFSGASSANLTTSSGTIAWVTVTVPSGTAAGDYEVSLTVDSLSYVSGSAGTSDDIVKMDTSSIDVNGCTVTVANTGSSSSGDSGSSGDDDEGGSSGTTVAGGTIVVGDASIDVSETDSVIVPLNITENGGFAGLTLTVSVPDGFEVTAAEYINGDDYAVTADMTGELNANGENGAVLVFASSANVTDTGVIAWLTYTATSSAANGEFEISVTVDEAYDASDLHTNLASYYTTESGALTVSGVSEAEPEPEPDPTSGTVSVGSVSASVADSDTVLVPISIADNEGFAGMTLTVSVPEGWTTSNVYFASGEDYAVTADMTSSFKVNAKTNADVTVTFASAENMTDNGVLCWIEYVVPSNASSGTSVVSVTVTEAYTAEALTSNWAENFTTVSGTITLTAPTITVGSSTVNLADNEDVVLVPVSIENNVGFAGMTLTVTVPEGWKTSNVYFVNGSDYAITADMTSAFSINAKTNADVTVTFASSENVTEDGVLCWIEYVVPAAVGEYEVTATVSELYTADALTNNLAGSCESVAGTLTVVQPVVSAGSVAADNNVGTCVLVPISIAGNAGFAGMTLTVSVPDDWTTTNVYFVNGDDYAITADMTSSFKIDAKSNGDVTVTFASAENVAGDGVLCWVEYTWTGSVDEGEYAVSVTVDEAYAADDLTTNLASYYTAEGGTITVSSYGYSISVDADSVTAGDTVTVTLTVTGDNTEDAVFYVTYSSDLFMFESAEGAAAADGDGAVALTLTEAGTVTLTFTVNDCEESATGEFSTYYIYSGATESSAALSVSVSYVKYYTVTLQTSSGSEIASCSVSAGSTVGSVLTEDDLSAGDSAGWIISGGDGTKYTSEEVLAMTVTDDITFRVYKKSSSGGSSSGGSSSGTSSSTTDTDDTGTTDTTMNTTPIEIAATEIMTAEEAAEAVAAMTDVDPTAYYYDATLWAVQNGIINGTSDVTFDPEIGCTRAMIVTLLYRLAGTPEFGISDTGFIDVSESAYYYDAVLWAVENGITNGVSDDMFAPDLICTREQIVTLMYRFVGQPETDAELIFTDVNPDYYSTNAIIWAYANGITDGIGDNQFGPTLDCTRAQVVTFLYRFAQL